MSNNNKDLIIGTSNFDGRGGVFTKKRFFYVKANEPNVYRVLPPVKSLAATGEFYKYYRVHRNLRATDGKQRSFLCVEEMDFKTKILKTRCPLCDKRREHEAEYKRAQEAARSNPGITKEKLNEYRMTFIDPLNVEGRFFLNVVNLAGEIGILPIPTKLKNDMVETFKQMKNTDGIDPTGKTGVFFDFVKISKYKGDNQPVYKINAYYESTPGPDGRVTKTYKYHEITTAFVDKMKKEVSDLSSIHRSLTLEEITALANGTLESRKQMLDNLFNFGEPADEESEPADLQPIPGVGGAMAVGSLSLGSSGVVSNSFNNVQAAAPVEIKPAAASQAQATPASPAFDFGSLAQGGGTAAAASKTLSDEDFEKYFMSGQGGK